MTAAGGVRFDHRGRAGVITLERPEALNALTLEIAVAIRQRLEAWAGDDGIERVLIKSAGGRAFCAGGDIRALYELGRARDRRFFAFFREEYWLNTVIKRYPKPYIALIDGIVMGGGVGLSVHGCRRVGTERLTFAMPETGIGFYPDVGGTYFLPRCPGEIGMYLALTGARLKVADAIHAGIVTDHVRSDRLEALERALCEDDDVDAVLARFAEHPGEAPLAARRADIDYHFSRPSVEGILYSLDADPAPWAKEQAAILRKRSPTSLKITYRQIRAGRHLDFEDCMRLEYRMAHGTFDGHDFFEGIRAAVIDKDQAPRWQPARLEDVSEAKVARHFAPLE